MSDEMRRDDTTRPERVFYDGDCGFCHHSVRFLVRHDRRGLFRYAPLDGPTFRDSVSAEERAAASDSMLLQTSDGRLLERSQAVIAALDRLGGGWRFLARTFALVPRPLRDLGYRFVARIRRRLFPPPEGVCPVLPPELRQRFDP